MESKDEFKKTDIKNHTWSYFDYTKGITDINFIDILLDKKTKIF